MKKAKKNVPEIRSGGSGRTGILLEVKETGGEWLAYNFDFVKHFEVIKPHLEFIPEPEEEED